MVSIVGKAGLSRVSTPALWPSASCVGQSARAGHRWLETRVRSGSLLQRAKPKLERFDMLRMDSDMTAQKKKVPANSNTKKHDFKTNDHVVYPTHGVGRIARVEEQEVAGAKLELFV